jgi:hypothetical protein
VLDAACAGAEWCLAVRRGTYFHLKGNNMDELVWGFFYGGLINPEVMQRVGMAPKRQEVATLAGYDIRIEPWVNLVPSTDDVAYGLLMQLTHRELAQAYGQLKVAYYPFPVVARDLEGRFVAALCYLSPGMDAGQAERAHVENLLKPATALGFPEWYLAKIRQFLPA